ncbi:MAG: hypothetical protein LBG92_00610 [Prevotellaceae bacterium]|jgi:hypothetical protein|nr:hypothetical protein [Prevotellaceae bacterium]
MKIIKTVTLIFFGVAVVSCSKRDTLQKVSSDEILERPTEETKNMRIISTSNGRLRNTIFAKTAITLREKDTVLHICPDGLYIASYKDSLLESTLIADSATIRENPVFFTATGNVVATNLLENKRLETEGPLFWNSQKKTIEVFVFSTIYTPTDTTYAHEIRSDDKFEKTLLKKQSGVFER